VEVTVNFLGNPPHDYWGFVWNIVVLTVPATTIVLWTLLLLLEGKIRFFEMVVVSIAVSVVFEPRSMSLNMGAMNMLGVFDYISMIIVSSVLWFIGVAILLYLLDTSTKFISTKLGTS
jgi:hypothetical protein